MLFNKNDNNKRRRSRRRRTNSCLITNSLVSSYSKELYFSDLAQIYSNKRKIWRGIPKLGNVKSFLEKIKPTVANSFLTRCQKCDWLFC